jgi:hypothetical protein
MNIKDDDLPALPGDSETPASSQWEWSGSDMRNYARAAIEKWAARQAPAAEPIHQVFRSDGTWEDVSAEALANCEANGKETRTLYTAPVAAQAPQTDAEEGDVWPIAVVTVDDKGKITAGETYMPGLPPGKHNLFPVRVPYMDEHTEAWQAVVKALHEVAPGFMAGPGNGIECAVAAIRWLASQAPAVPEGQATAALRELVECKRIKDRAEALHFAGPLSDAGEGWKAEYDRLKTDYIRRQPEAWDAARAVLATGEKA